MPAGEPPPYPPGSLIDRALAWDVAGTRRLLQSGAYEDDELQDAICGCVLKATGYPEFEVAAVWEWSRQSYTRLVQQLAWSYAHLPGPSQQQLQVLRELVQYAAASVYEGVGASALVMAAASGCMPLVRILVEQPQSITAADIGILQDWKATPASEPPRLVLVRSLTDVSRTVVVPQAVRWPGQTQVAEEASHLQWPGSVSVAAASGNAEVVYAYIQAGWTSDGGCKGWYETRETYAGLAPIHWAAAVSLATKLSAALPGC
jgi:hypothetical protein